MNEIIINLSFNTIRLIHQCFGLYNKLCDSVVVQIVPLQIVPALTLLDSYISVLDCIINCVTV